jgi:hypothetical protein
LPLTEEESQKMWQELLDAITPIFRKFTAVSAKTLEQARTVEALKAKFPTELADLLKFEDTADLVIIKPRQFLGAENFAKIAQIVREVGGEYVSAGKDSHFRVPKVKP